MTVVDTTLLIDLERAWPPAQRMIADLESLGGPVLVPAAVWLEYFAGVSVGAEASLARLLERAATFVPLDRGIVDEAVRLRHECNARGRRLSWTDLQVAGTARHLREELVSCDERFQGIPGLTVRRY